MQQEIEKANGEYAGIIPSWLDPTFHDDYLLERVSNFTKRPCLLFDFLSRWHIKSRLDIISVVTAVCNKVHFERFSDSLSLFVCRALNEIADINPEASDAKFIKDDVLHNMAFLLLTKSEYCITDADVGEIVFRQRTDISLAFEVEPD